MTQYWNWIVDYFSVLFWYRPIPEWLEDWPAKAWQTVRASFSRQRVRASLKYVALLLGLFWLHTGPLIAIAGRLVYSAEVALLCALFMYHGINPRSRLYGKVCSNGNRNHRQIALTFDDGPNGLYTSQVLNILGQYGIKATFFVIGQNASCYPEVCRQIVVAGNVIGNHSYHHQKSLCLKRSKAVTSEIELAHQAIYECCGFAPKLFRPPHGFRTPWLMRTIHRLGYAVVTWDNMTSDWKTTKPAEEIVTAVVKRAKPGGIIVLHDGCNTRKGYDRTQMLKALPQIIEALKERGFDFVTVPELLVSEAIPLFQQP